MRDCITKNIAREREDSHSSPKKISLYVLNDKIFAFYLILKAPKVLNCNKLR